jgi:hypothetical protein
MFLLAGWGIGQLFENPLPDGYKITIFLKFALVLSLGIISVFALLISDPVSPNYNYWKVTSLLTCGYVAWFLWSHRSSSVPWRPGLFILYFFLLILTIRVSYKANFQNADQGKEYLVYAHGSGSIRNAIDLIAKIVNRTGSENEQLSISFDAGGKTQGVSWPIKWYMRDFPQAELFYGIDEALLHADIIIADPQSFILVDELTKNAYVRVDYIRMVWPNQDYFSFKFADIERLLSDAQFRRALISIWYKRDYSFYSNLSSVSGFDRHNWNPSDPMRIYVRKSIIQQIWEYGLLSPLIQK